MKREFRYVIVKFKDIQAALTRTEAEILLKLTSKVESKRLLEGRGTMKAVVVEHDWPEYELVWWAIEQRVDGELEAIAQTSGEGT